MTSRFAQEVAGAAEAERHGQRLWIVSLFARSAARFLERQNIHMIASPQTTVPVAGVRIRDQWFNVEGGSYAGALVAEAAGWAPDAESAVRLLGNLASPYLQLVAVAANAAVSPDVELHAFAPPDGVSPGLFVSQVSCIPERPAPRTRVLKGADLMRFIEAMQEHAREDRIHRAMAHFRLALEALDPQNWLLAAEWLFISCENLLRVILHRLYREAGLQDRPESKHELAMRAGFEPVDGNPVDHLNRFDSHVRATEIFEGDVDCYADLKFASDHFEHGSRDFDAVRGAADRSALQSFAYVRRSILREVGVENTSGLFDEVFDHPVGRWDPRLELTGEYSDTAEYPGPGFAPDTANQDWPQFAGLNLRPRITSIVDDDTTRKRSITIKADGSGGSLLESQTVHGEIATTWVLPGLRPGEVASESDSEVELVIRSESQGDTDAPSK